MATIEKMTLEELQQLIDTRIDQRLAALLGKFEMNEEDLFSDEELDTRTWEQVKEDIERNRWTPPPGAKSSLELLREDRDS
ncbi:MAG: hypothetical protein L0154_03305 [Chloroflexi bacterium]|nr:hypothetical protein [Chloroflexota bacterium]